MILQVTSSSAVEENFAAEHERLIKEIWGRIAKAGTSHMVLLAAREELQQLLRRESGGPARDKSLALIESYFASIALLPTRTAVESLKGFVELVTRIVLAARTARKDPKKTELTLISSLDRAREFVLARPDRPTEIILAPYPVAERQDDFPTLLAQGILYRLRIVLSFFQRSNPTVKRQRKPLFLFTPEFAVRLEQVVELHILPRILSRKLIDFIGTQRDWAEITTQQLWPTLDKDGHTDKVLELWKAAWEGLHRRKITREEDGQAKEVWQCRPDYKEVRALLTCDAYELPEFDNDFLAFLAGLLTDYSAEALEAAWARLRQFYEQEMDQRVYQDRARDGALRDSLLDCFTQYPDRFSEMIVLLCYYCFPRLSLRFLVTFTHSRGKTEEERKERIPLLIRFLEHEGSGDIMAQEDAAEEARQRALAEQYARYRLAADASAKPPKNAICWSLTGRSPSRRMS